LPQFDARAGIGRQMWRPRDGINGGVQAGYNWQAANLVFGLEADIQGSTQKDNKTAWSPARRLFSQPMTPPCLGSARRGRLGYSVGSTLF